ncbi:hypothetical protein [Metabacillus arenae]|uniref:Uncharacterized protein n=1 Tax=Metabacillus arenae TaxID=2771434 RepID=A0A926N9A7_9BACI|nr:hypothetical protein [Metabacillus arenae]MBD1379109.1 hypothetical protein [Metabacillus arenae]
MNCIVTSDITKASHWLAKEDENNEFSNVTVGNLYALKYDEREHEYYIIDDEDRYSLIFLCHEGDFVIVN